jgi:hypothetical protein
MLFQSCSTDNKYSFILQAENGSNLTTDTKIFFLGVEVGKVNEIHFGKLEERDFVFATFELNDKTFLNAKSYLQWSQNATLEIINIESGNDLKENDTILLYNGPINETNIQSSEIIITPLSSDSIFGNDEIQNLSKEEKIKLDSLQEKIKKLNNLIQEVNDKN